ncbi:Ger(x)C family spore germination protein [Alkaliphilus peptidifermentans]|uniref:Germination protein, Ger(X)C family n=1 Tax=Alkaliphilus peptidifermentans DSM 18978 TaxID=1120976 RepID=A0A1G5C0W2_9FIRM|nr:Ger(x)C family spore germination protein [Alkaliphilus peptidifermentans]SCX95934.1 germination protein, Ger(x)C family [Alkaliphilus peptidifermentans DSM 18978]
MKKILKLTIIFLMLILFTSCWDSRDLEELLLVYGIGFDINENNPEEYVITIGFPTIIEDAPESKHEFSVIAPSFGSGKTQLQNVVYREISYGNVRIIVFSEDVARLGIYPHVDAMLREPIFNGTTRFAVVNTRAEELLKLKPPVALLVSTFIYDSIEQGHRTTTVPFTTLRNFNNELFNDGIEPSIPYVCLGEKDFELKVECIALFKGDRMVHLLKGENSTAFMLLKGEINEGFIHASYENEDKEEHISIVLKGGTSKIKTRVEGSRLYIDQEIKINSSLAEYTGKETVFDEAIIKKLESIVTEYYKDVMQETLSILQELECDNIGYGRYVKANHPDIFNAETWNEDFAEAIITAHPTVSIRSVGVSH